MEAPMKLLYSFIICDCSPAGIWVVDLEIATVYCAIKLDLTTAEKVFIETGKAVNLNNGKWFFPGFIEHQYPQGLQTHNPAHKSIIKELKEYNLLNEDLTLNIQAPNKPLTSPSQGAKVMVMDKVEEKGKVTIAAKTEISPEKIPPSKSDFLEHGKALCTKSGLNFFELQYSIEVKYDAWKESGWKDGHGAKIKNWKTKLANTLPFLKSIKKPQEQKTW